jgi:endo-1,4-beta-xylanase
MIVGTAAALTASQMSSCTTVDRTQTGATGSGRTEPSPGTAVRTTAPALRAAASSRGRYFGAAVQASKVLDSHYRSIVARDCASITPEWEMKWDALAPSGSYAFGEMDRLADFAGRNGLALRGHTLLWHRSVPAWAARQIASTRDWSHVHEHIRKVMTRYGSRINEWDVINEPIEPNDGAGGLRNNQFLRAYGPDYIEWALYSAHEFAPRSLKMINEYGLEYNTDYEGQRRIVFLRLLERLRSRGVPMEAVGLQAHLDLRKGSIYRDGVYGLIREIAGMGLKVVITELDVAEASQSQSIEKRDMLVADETRRYLDVVLEFDNVIGVNTWGLNDTHSWLRTQRNAANRGLPYDGNWQPKPMHEAIVTAMA